MTKNWYKTALSKWYDFAPTVTLYHGTSETNLPNILEEGLKVLDPEKLLDNLLRVAGVTKEEIPDYIWKYELQHRGSDPRIHLSTSFNQSAGYARTTAKGFGEYEYVIVDSLNEWLEENGKPKIEMKEVRPVVLTIEIPWDKIETHKSLDDLKEVVERVTKAIQGGQVNETLEEYLEDVPYEFWSNEGISSEFISKWEYVEPGRGIHELV